MKNKPNKNGRKESRREQILESAKDILVSQGYAALSIERISSQLGISKGNVTYHFPSKGELVREMFNKLIDDSKEKRYPAEVRDAGDTRNRFERYVDNDLEVLSQPRLDAQAWETYAYGAHDKSVRKMVDDILRWYMKEIADALEDVRQDLTAAQRMQLAKIVLAFSRGMLLFIGSSRGKGRQREEDRKMARIFILKLAEEWQPD